MAKMTYAQAGAAAVAEEMRRDPTIFHLSTDAPPPLVEEFGETRVRASPIAEGALTGMAIGAAGSGMRPIVNWSLVTFCFVAMDQIVNQASKIHYMFGGQAKFPILFRTIIGGAGSRAAQHSQTPYSMFMNLAGLKLILPSTPADMKGLLTTAIRDDNPVISFESSHLLGMEGEVPDGDHAVPLGVADIKREGSDVTIVGFGRQVHEALAAAEVLEREGVSAEVVDPRTLAPLDAGTIRASVVKTGRLVVADDAAPMASAASEIAALVTEDDRAFASLKAPVRRVCALEVPIPYSPAMEQFSLPGRDSIVDAVRGVMAA